MKASKIHFFGFLLIAVVLLSSCEVRKMTAEERKTSPNRIIVRDNSNNDNFLHNDSKQKKRDLIDDPTREETNYHNIRTREEDGYINQGDK